MDIRRNGFTLIELLSVMAVMVMITTIVVASGFGLRRSASYTSAMQVPRSVLEYAHQRACMDGRKTAVLFAPNGKNSSEFAASIFQANGIIYETDTGGNGSITDIFSDIAKADSGAGVLTVFNFKSGKKFIVNKVERHESTSNMQHVDFNPAKENQGPDYTVDGEAHSYFYPTTIIHKSSDDKENPAITGGNWEPGSTYGFEIADRQILPVNFTYAHKSGGHKSTGNDGSFWFIFNPDGSTDGSGTATLTVQESVGKGNFKQEISIN